MQVNLLIDAELCARPSHGLLRLHRIVERMAATVNLLTARRATARSVLEDAGLEGETVSGAGGS